MKQLTLLLIPVLVFFSCKKDSSSNPNGSNTPTGKVKKIIVHDTSGIIPPGPGQSRNVDTTSFTYDNNGNLTNIHETDSVLSNVNDITFQYVNNNPVSFVQNGNPGIINCNSQGQIVYDSGSSVENIQYFSNGTIITNTGNSTGNYYLTDTAKVVSGNVVKYSSYDQGLYDAETYGYTGYSNPFQNEKLGMLLSNENIFSYIGLAYIYTGDPSFSYSKNLSNGDGIQITTNSSNQITKLSYHWTENGHKFGFYIELFY